MADSLTYLGPVKVDSTTLPLRRLSDIGKRPPSAAIAKAEGR